MFSSGFVLGLFALTLNTVYGLKCYTCDDTQGVSCKPSALFTNLPEEECSVENNQFLEAAGVSLKPECVKIAAHDDNGNEIAIRKCISNHAKAGNKICEQATSLVKLALPEIGDNLMCSTCDTDLCNSGIQLSGVTFVVGVVAAFLAFIF